jgi:hypothetical protein
VIDVQNLDDIVRNSLKSQNLLTEKRVFGVTAPKQSLEPSTGLRQANSSSNLKLEKLSEKNRKYNVPRTLFMSNLSRDGPIPVPSDSHVHRKIREKMKDFGHREIGLCQFNSSCHIAGSHGKPCHKDSKASRGTSTQAKDTRANLYEVFGHKKSAVTHRPGSYRVSERSKRFKLSFTGEKRDTGLLSAKNHPIQKELNFGLEDGEIPLDLSCRKSAYGQPNGCSDYSSVRALPIKGRPLPVRGVAEGARATIDVGGDLKNFTSLGEDFGTWKGSDCHISPSKLAGGHNNDLVADNHVILLKGSLDMVSKELLSAKKRLEGAHGDDQHYSVINIDQRIQRMIGYLKSATKVLEKETPPRDSLTKKADATGTDLGKATRFATQKPSAEVEKKVKKLPAVGTRNFKFKRFLYKSDLN